MNSLLQGFGRLQKLINRILAFLLGLMMLVVFLQIFTRYVVFHSIPWSEELSRFLFVGLIVMGMNIGISKNMLVRIDILDGYLGKRTKRAVEMVRLLIGFFMNVAFAYSCMDMVKIGKLQRSPAMQIPMHYMYMVIMAGFVLAGISVLLKMAEETIQWREEGK